MSCLGSGQGWGRRRRGEELAPLGPSRTTLGAGTGLAQGPSELGAWPGATRNGESGQGSAPGKWAPKGEGFPHTEGEVEGEHSPGAQAVCKGRRTVSWKAP